MTYKEKAHLQALLSLAGQGRLTTPDFIALLGKFLRVKGREKYSLYLNGKSVLLPLK